VPLFHHKPPAPPPPPDLERLRQEIEQQLEIARTFDGVVEGDGVDIPITLHKGERFFSAVTGAILIETRRGAGHWQGANQGVSVRVPGTASMRYRIGQTKGSFVPGDESPTPIDEGTFALTNQRATFMGAKQTREWLWSKLVGVAHQPAAPWTAIAVSNRQKTSGVGYDTEHAGLIRFSIDLAVAKANDSTERLIQELEAELAAAGGAIAPPVTAAISAPAASVGPVAGARWAPDPAGRFELRWWDGREWTDHVTTGGVPANDPLAPNVAPPV